VERLINRLQQHWWVATRYEKRVANYRAMLSFGCILLWFLFGADVSNLPRLPHSLARH
jgi:hypothetical protein